MEDLEQPVTSLDIPLLTPEAFTLDLSTPGPEASKPTESKPVKKRKSWGQVLPEPKTSLPPRKRAKTADEKEQRRIERVKRNRLAAHNSRERKRQEVENLQHEKNLLEQKLRQAQEVMAQMARQLQKLQDQTGIKLSPTLQPTTTFDFIPSLHSETINPLEASSASSTFESPALTTMSYDSPADSPMQPETPEHESSAAEADLTQHSAAMLCDLQCRSSFSSRTTKFLLAMSYFILFNIQLCMTTALSTTYSLLTRSRALPAPLTRTKASSPLPSAPAWPSLLSTPLMSIYLALLRGSSICTPTQAQHLLLATSMALRRDPSSRLLSRFDVTMGKASLDSRLDLDGIGQEHFSRMWRILTAANHSSSSTSDSSGTITEDIRRSCETLDSLLGGRRPDGGRQKGFRGL